MMRPIKQTVYLPVSDFNSSERAVCTIGIPDLYSDKVVEKEGIFLTSEEYNQHIKEVIEDTLRVAAEKAEMKLLIDEENDIIEEATIDKKSITNTFKQTYKKWKL
jgi:hypothetical protein